MPEAVVTLLEQHDVEKTQQVLQNILNAYALDFSKYAESKDIPKINHFGLQYLSNWKGIIKNFFIRV